MNSEKKKERERKKEMLTVDESPVSSMKIFLSQKKG